MHLSFYIVFFPGVSFCRDEGEGVHGETGKGYEKGRVVNGGQGKRTPALSGRTTRGVDVLSSAHWWAVLRFKAYACGHRRTSASHFCTTVCRSTNEVFTVGGRPERGVCLCAFSCAFSLLPYCDISHARTPWDRRRP